MKATGLGFGLAPNSFEVLKQKGEFESIVHVGHTDWHLKQMNLRDGLACAVAVGNSWPAAKHCQQNFAKGGTFDPIALREEQSFAFPPLQDKP